MIAIWEFFIQFFKYFDALTVGDNKGISFAVLETKKINRMRNTGENCIDKYIWKSSCADKRSHQDCQMTWKFI